MMALAGAAVVIVTGFETKDLQLKFYKVTINIRQKAHTESKVLWCFSKKSDFQKRVCSGRELLHRNVWETWEKLTYFAAASAKFAFF